VLTVGKLIHAYTKLGSIYPGYINFTREDDGTISVYLRGDPVTTEGVRVCGYACDKGKPGRCTPGDANCNNYCNMAPQKGPMQDGPLNCTQIICGETVKLSLSAAEFESLLVGIAS
jgi:hypothetical protein